VILQLELNLSLFSKCLDKILIDLNIGDIALFELDTVLSELSVEFLHHGLGHVRLQVKDLTQPDTVDEVTDVFFAFSG
jgi:hypothetical protein